MAEKAGLEIATAKRVSGQGGSILYTLARNGDADALQNIRCDRDNDPGKIAHFEKNYFSCGEIFADFIKRTEQKLKNFVTYVNRSRQRGGGGDTQPRS